MKLSEAWSVCVCSPTHWTVASIELVCLIDSSDYGLLTAISGRLPSASNSALSRVLEQQSHLTGVSAGDLLLSWAYYCLGGIVVTTSTRAERLESTFRLLESPKAPVDRDVFDAIEQAALEDGAEGKVFYGHPHVEKARLETLKARGGGLS